MSTEVVTLQTVQERVKERIQQSFMDLIPPELWQGMVQRELESFTRTEFPKMVKQAAEERLREMLKVEFSKSGWMEEWTGNGPTASEFLAGVLKEVAPDLVSALFSRLGNEIVQSIRNGGVISRY
jgi:uncharacterized membrane protein YheB (UPF0754 family)